MSRTEPSELAERGRRVLALEAEAICRVAERLGPAFSAAVRLLERAKGRLIVSGVGKSGLIARKIAATLTRPAALHRSSIRWTRFTATWGSWGETTWPSCSRRAALPTSCSPS